MKYMKERGPKIHMTLLKREDSNVKFHDICRLFWLYLFWFWLYLFFQLCKTLQLMQLEVCLEY